MSESTDLFGHRMGSSQLNLFGEGDKQWPAPERPMVDHPARARERLTAILELARRAQSMPWSERDARMWQTVFPQMANWLPDEEANQLRFDFAQEMERLKAA